MNKVTLGCTVVAGDAGRCYPTHLEMMKKMNFKDVQDLETVEKCLGKDFTYIKSKLRKEEFIVFGIQKHSFGQTIAGIEHLKTGQQYLVALVDLIYKAPPVVLMVELKYRNPKAGEEKMVFKAIGMDFKTGMVRIELQDDRWETKPIQTLHFYKLVNS